jgi:hypothetical protein
VIDEAQRALSAQRKSRKRSRKLAKELLWLVESMRTTGVFQIAAYSSGGKQPLREMSFMIG